MSALSAFSLSWYYTIFSALFFFFVCGYHARKIIMSKQSLKDHNFLSMISSHKCNFIIAFFTCLLAIIDVGRLFGVF